MLKRNLTRGPVARPATPAAGVLVVPVGETAPTPADALAALREELEASRATVASLAAQNDHLVALNVTLRAERHAADQAAEDAQGEGTVAAARTNLADKIHQVGAALCPCCDQEVRAVTRQPGAVPIKWLMALVAAYDAALVDDPQTVAVPVVAVIARGITTRDYAHLVNFTVEGGEPLMRSAGVGWWTPTQAARDFLAGRATVPAWVTTVAGRVWAVSADRLTVGQVLAGARRSER